MNTIPNIPDTFDIDNDCRQLFVHQMGNSANHRAIGTIGFLGAVIATASTYPGICAFAFNNAAWGEVALAMLIVGAGMNLSSLYAEHRLVERCVRRSNSIEEYIVS